MKLSHLTNKTLLLDIKKLVESERMTMIALLYHLKEVDQRKLFSDLKYPSLFAYCVRELGYSDSAAQRRIVACRMLELIPEIGPKIEDGSLTLTNVGKVADFTKDPDERKVFLTEVEGLTTKECEKKLFDLTDKKIPAKDLQKRISRDEFLVSIVLNEETVKKLEHLKSMLGKNSLDDVLGFAVEAAIQKIEKTKFKVNKGRKSPPPAEVKRSPVAAVKREVYLKDKKCAKCGSVHRLEFDHRRPWSLGGSSTIDNIRILCRQCNQRMSMRAGYSSKSQGPPRASKL